MARYALNNKKANNYAFFCPVSRLHLTWSNPIGTYNGITPPILRGLKTGAILDLDNAVDVEKGVLKTAQQEPVVPPVVVPKIEEQPKQRGKRKTEQSAEVNTEFIEDATK